MVSPLVISELKALLDAEPVEEVFIALPREKYGPVVETIVHLCEEQGIIVRVQPEIFNLKVAKWHMDMLDGMPMVTIRSGPSDGWSLVAKRLIDICGSAVFLLAAAPLMLLTAVLIKLDSPGPVLYSQERVGKNGRTFRVYKFRSMRTDAERDGPVWASREGDARTTRVGRVIRKIRVDEIPQFWNILKGEMNFVGPRPERPHFVRQLAEEIPFYEQRHLIPPGLTGWAQIKYPYGASIEDARQKLQYDLYYIKNQSLVLDAVIIFETVKTILFGRGAR